MTERRDKYADVVIKALKDLEERNGEITSRNGRERILGPWWDTDHIWKKIHGYDPLAWHRPGRSYDIKAQRKQRRSPAPGRDRVVRTLNTLKRNGEILYDPMSVGQISRWRTTDGIR